MQLDDLISDLAKAKDMEAAAKMDVSDRAQDHRETKLKLDKAEQCLNACAERVNQLRGRVHRLIEAHTHSGYEDELLCIEGPAND